MTNFLGDIFCSFPSDSLFSTITTFYTLALLYFPSFSLQFIFSPVIFSTIILLLCLLRLGAAQKSAPESGGSGRPASDSPPKIDESIIDRDWKSTADLGQCSRSEPDPKSARRAFYADSFVEWDVRAPLEVIHEEYEGEEEDGVENGAVWEARRESEMNAIRKYASLSLYYPESDSDASSEGDFTVDGDWGSPENACFRWEEEEEGEEDDREGLIEIELNGGKKGAGEVEEDNLIEIELFPAS
ncbi:class II aminoacyl-tRNA and biotin synthetasessuperfamily protein [Striga asiatica]|uniref:Class II aminoacyl-tRNA and biotin synthetasessuperfamily protein n=1 Tax=Striga asiatica TaxID=4170 RepID=A0A5A7R6H9_STRAF|nr:class II aminoacyl-tRNA and biotin synthetasessuperfamily protein [Striga asiatica]